MVAEIQQVEDTQKKNILGQPVTSSMAGGEGFVKEKPEKQEKPVIPQVNNIENFYTNYNPTRNSNSYQSGISDSKYSIYNTSNISSILNDYPEINMPYVDKDFNVKATLRNSGEEVDLGVYAPNVQFSETDQIANFTQQDISDLYGIRREITQFAANNNISIPEAGVNYFTTSKNKFVMEGKSPQERYNTFLQYSNAARKYLSRSLTEEGFLIDQKGQFLYQPSEARVAADRYLQLYFGIMNSPLQLIDLGANALLSIPSLAGLGIPETKAKVREYIGGAPGKEFFPREGEGSLLGKAGLFIRDKVETIIGDGEVLGVNFDINPQRAREIANKVGLVIDTAEPVTEGFLGGQFYRTAGEFVGIGVPISKAIIKGGQKLLAKDQAIINKVTKETADELNPKVISKTKAKVLGRKEPELEFAGAVSLGEKMSKGVGNVARYAAKHPAYEHYLNVVVSTGSAGGISVAREMGYGEGTQALFGLAGGFGSILGPNAIRYLFQRQSEEILKGKGVLPLIPRTLQAAQLQKAGYKLLEKKVPATFLGEKIPVSFFYKDADFKDIKLHRVTSKLVNELKKNNPEFVQKTKMGMEAFLDDIRAVDPTGETGLIPIIPDILGLESMKAINQANIANKMRVSLLGGVKKGLISDFDVILKQSNDKRRAVISKLIDVRDDAVGKANVNANAVSDYIEKISGIFKADIPSQTVQKRVSSFHTAFKKIENSTDPKVFKDVASKWRRVEELDGSPRFDDETFETLGNSIKDLEEIQASMKGALIKEKFFKESSFRDLTTTQQNSYKKNVEDLIDTAYSSLKKKYNNFYKAQTQEVDASNLLNIFKTNEAFDQTSAIKIFKGNKQATIKTSTYIDDITQKSAKNYVKSLDDAGKTDLLTRIEAINIRDDLGLAIPKKTDITNRFFEKILIAYPEKLNLPIKDSVRNLHSVKSSLWELFRKTKAIDPKASVAIKPTAEAFEKGYETALGNSQYKNVRRVDAAYKQEIVQGYFDGAGRNLIKMDKRGLRKVSGEVAMDNFLKPADGSFVKTGTDFDLIFPPKTFGINKTGVIGKVTNAPVRKTAEHLLRERWFRNQINIEDSKFTLENLQKIKNSSLFTEGAGKNFAEVLDEPMAYLKTASADIDTATNTIFKQKGDIIEKTNTLLETWQNAATNNKFKGTIVEDIANSKDFKPKSLVDQIFEPNWLGGDNKKIKQLMDAIETAPINQRHELKNNLRSIILDGTIETLKDKALPLGKFSGEIDMIAFYKLVNENANSMKTLGLKKSHIKRLQKLADVGLSLTSQGSIMNIANVPRGYTLEGVLSRFYAINRGVVSVRFIFSEMALRLLKMKNYKILQEVMNNEKAAILFSKLLIESDPLSNKTRTQAGRIILNAYRDYRTTSTYKQLKAEYEKDPLSVIKPFPKDISMKLNKEIFGDSRGLKFKERFDKMDFLNWTN